MYLKQKFGFTNNYLKVTFGDSTNFIVIATAYYLKNWLNNKSKIILVF